MPSKKWQRRQRQRKQCIKRNAQTNARGRIQKYPSVRQRSTHRSSSPPRTIETADGSDSGVVTSMVRTLWRSVKLTTRAGSTITTTSSKDDAFASLLPATTPAVGSSIITIVVLLTSLVALRIPDAFSQAMAEIHPSSSTRMGVLALASALVSIGVPLLFWCMGSNASRVGSGTERIAAPESSSDTKNDGDAFAMALRPLGLRPSGHSAFSMPSTTIAPGSSKKDDDGDDAATPPRLAAPERVRRRLAEWLPFGLKHTSDLELVFATNVHGRSPTTLYHLLEERGSSHTILLLEALTGESCVIVGMYASHRWRDASTKPYGDGRCFLFRICDDETTTRDDSKCWNWTPPPLSSERASTSHHEEWALWDTFQRSNRDGLGLGIGASGVGAGLWLNHDLTRGESCRAVGFDNEPLVGVRTDDNAKKDTAGGVQFEVGLVEVYQLVREIDGLPVR